MKKLVLIGFLLFGMFSFASQGVINDDSNNNVNNISIELNSTNSYVTVEDPDTEGFYRCRADITYNGEYVTSRYGFGSTEAEACANARKAAIAFIEAQ